VVRRIETGKLPAGGELEQFLDQWRLGRDVFLSACARCHGDDGSLEICGDVKPLTGIGNRLTPAQVYERLRPGDLGRGQVLIRGRFHQRREVEAVVVFVRGL
jgi:mono/diheme cytochrome c family protein